MNDLVIILNCIYLRHFSESAKTKQKKHIYIHIQIQYCVILRPSPCTSFGIVRGQDAFISINWYPNKTSHN